MRTAARVLLILAIVATVLGASTQVAVELLARQRAFYFLVGSGIAAGLGGCAFIAASIALILGIVSHRKPVWVGAAVVNIISVAIVVFGAMAAFRAGRTLLVETRDEMFMGSDANMRRWFKWGTDIDLPPEAQFISGRDYSAWLSDIHIKIRVPTGFKTTLDQRLARAQTQPEELIPPQDVRADQPDWPVAGFDKMICYEHKTSDSAGGGFLTKLALDEENGILYCVVAEYAYQ